MLAYCGRMNLIATRVPSVVCTPTHTVPIPPEPRSDSTRYLPPTVIPVKDWSSVGMGVGIDRRIVAGARRESFERSGGPSGDERQQEERAGANVAEAVERDGHGAIRLRASRADAGGSMTRSPASVRAN